MKTKNIFLLVAVLLYAPLFLVVSCSKDDGPSEPARTEQTLFMYMPWSSNLTSHFEQNLKDFEAVIKQDILKNNRVVVFFSSSPTEATLFEMKLAGGNSVRQTLKSYQNHSLTTAEGITAILNDVASFAPANRYAMTVSGHGMGWLPVSTTMAQRSAQKNHWEYEGVPLTRYFGGTSPEYQTDITTLADGIVNAGLKMEYILFDDCYMSSIEVAYDLKKATNYLIASPTEIMAYGFPYHIIGKYLVNNDFDGICQGFYDFYANYDIMPCGTIAIINCFELDNLATIMKNVNQQFSFNTALISSIQTLDGYNPTIFFDYGDYAAKLCTDNDLLAIFEAQLERAVPKRYRKHTPTYYTMSKGQIAINSFSGVAISDPSTNSSAALKTETSWYKATH